MSQAAFQPAKNYFAVQVSCVVAVGGLLFGYDTAVIAGAIGFLQTKFHLDAFMTGWVASSILFGCIIGATLAGILSDYFGRKKILIVSALLFMVSSILSAIPHTVTELVIGRIIGGLGIGITSLLSPLYIAEIAPAKIRGRLVSLNQLAIVIGIFVVYFVNAGIAGAGEAAWNINTGWRWMFGVGIIPSLIFLILLFFVTESPRWLVQKGRKEEALQILKRINNNSQQAKTQLDEIKKSIKNESGSIKELFRPGLRIALVIGVLLGIFQQFSGSNAIMYYAPEIFKSTGVGDNIAFIQTVMIGAVNMIFTLVAIWLIDKVGRKILLMVGSVSMAACLMIIGVCFHLGKTGGPWILIFILLAIASYAVSLAPVTWVIASEIFPTRIRGRAMSFVTVVIWIGDFVVSQTFPVLINTIGSALTFGTYALMLVLAFLFVLKVVPETRNKTLEDIANSWGQQKNILSRKKKELTD